jgi:hypothetical protein
MVVTAGEGGCASKAAHRDRLRGVLSERSVAELPGLAERPARHGAVSKERARELVTSDHPSYVGETGCDENGGIVVCAVGVLPELIPSHAPHGPIGKADAGVFATS